MTTDNRTEINDCDANTGWTGDDGTPTTVNVAGLFYQGTNSLSAQHTNADEHTYTTEDSLNTGTFSLDWSDSTVYMIVKTNQQDSQANGGMKVVIGDGTDRIGFETNGSDNNGVQLSNLFYGINLDVSNRASFTGHVFAGVLANLTVTAISQVGYGSNHLAKAQGATDNVYMDYIAYIANDSPALTINGGTVGTPETWLDVAGDDSTNGWGMVGNPVASQFQLNCPFEIGDTAAADSYFTMSGVQLYLFGQAFGATHFFWGLASNAGQTNQLVIDGSQIISVAGTTGSPCDLNWNDTNFNNLQVDGSLFVDVGNVTLSPNTANRWIRTSTFENPTTITPNAMEMTDCVFNAGASTAANGMIVLDTSGDSNQMANCTLNSDGSGHGFDISATGTYDFDNFTFTGYGADGTANAVVRNNSGGAVTINVQNGGDSPTVLNVSTSTTTINNAVTIRVDGVAEGTAVLMIANETVGTVTAGDILLQGLADSSGVVQDTGFNYEGAFGAGLDVLIRARSQGLPTAAIADDGGVFTDETTEANSGTTNDMTLTPTTPAVNDAYYFGHPEANWTQLKINISTAGSGFTLTWEYWTGAVWSALSGVTDGTSNFTNTGLNYVTWTLPSWATTTVNSQGPYYYVRARVSAVTTPTQALGRWCSLDVTRYLPIPPQGNLQRTITSAGLTATLSQAVDNISTF